MGWFRLAEGLARPIFEFIRPIPPIAWIPLTIYWFGIGLTGKVFIIWIGGIVPCVINSYVGVRMTNPVFLQMGRLYGATNWQLFWTVCIPSALPMVFGALQIALAWCWMNLVDAELLAANGGLGLLIQCVRKPDRPGKEVVGHDRRVHRHPHPLRRKEAPRRDAEVSHVPIHRQRNPDRIP